MICASASTWYSASFHTLLADLGDPRECGALSRRLLEHYLDYSLDKHLLDTPLSAGGDTLQAIKEAIARLAQGEPIQYILGSAPFLGHHFLVTPDVLIPRPETEEMVARLCEENNLEGVRILDIGTGSGCIAIALKKSCQQVSVCALDSSSSALALAKKNSLSLGAAVDWLLLDFLQEELPPRQWDIIVSNPPYIPASHKSALPLQVAAHEPPLALFVPDSDPLLFYERIASKAIHHLSSTGKVYVEIHEDYATPTARCFAEKGFQKVSVCRDLQGKERWVVATHQESV